MGSRKNYVIRIITDAEKLSSRATEVNPDEPIKKVTSVINDVRRTLKDHKDVVALCAPQLGYDKRIFSIKFKDKIMTFVNPMITHSEGQHFSRERNASLSSEYIIPRSDNITAIYQDEHGKIVENKFEGMAAEVFEQMCQMLDGVLLSDFGLEVLEGFDELSDNERSEILASYRDYLNNLGVKMDADIEADKDLRQMKQAIDYMTSVAKGETEVVPEYNGELDFTQSTKVIQEKEKQYEEEKKKRFLDKVEEIKNRDKCL